MLRRISSSGARRRPSGASSDGRDAVDVVGAERQRHLRQLRAVAQPVHLDVRHVRRRQTRDRHRLHVVVAGRRPEGAQRQRQRVERLDAAEAALQRADLAARSAARSPAGRPCATCRRTLREAGLASAARAPPRDRASVSSGTSASASRPASREPRQHGRRRRRPRRRSARRRPRRTPVTVRAPATARALPTALSGDVERRRRAGEPHLAARPAARASANERSNGHDGDAQERHARRRAAAAAARRPACRPAGCRRAAASSSTTRRLEVGAAGDALQILVEG